MQKVINRLKTLQARLQAIYLEMDCVSEQRTVMSYVESMIKLRMLLGLHSFKLCSSRMQKLADYLKELAYGYRSKYGEAMCSKIRRIASALEELVPKVQNHKSLKKISQPEETAVYQEYSTLYKLFHQTVEELENNTDNTGNESTPLDFDPLAIYRDTALLTVREADLLLHDRLAEDLVNENWFTGADINHALVNSMQVLLEVEEKMPDCAYKCGVYRIIAFTTDFIGFVEGQIKSNK